MARTKPIVIENEPIEENQSPRGDAEGVWWDWQATGVVIEPNAPLEKWRELWTLVRKTHGSVNWWIGDVLCFAYRTYPETWTQELDKHGVDFYKNAMWMANTYSPAQRVEGVSWSAHREIAKLEPKERDRWLRRAKKEDWTVSELRERLKEATEKAKPPASTYPSNAPPLLTGDDIELRTTPSSREMPPSELNPDSITQSCPQCTSEEISLEDDDPPYLVCLKCGWDNKPAPEPQMATAPPETPRPRIDVLREAIELTRKAAANAALGQDLPSEVQAAWTSCARNLLNLPLILRLLSVEKAMEWLPEEWELRSLQASSWAFGGRKYKVEVRKGKTNVAYGDGPWMAGAILDAALSAQISEMGGERAAAD